MFTRPIEDVRLRLDELIADLPYRGPMTLVTDDGHPKVVLQSFEAFERTQKLLTALSRNVIGKHGPR